MPLYHVEHAIPLTVLQQDELATAITDLHSTRFSTPRLFVNIEFIDVSNATTYVGGRRVRGNHIKANVRSGPSRTQQDWDDLACDIAAAWERIITPLPKVRRGDPDLDLSLRSVILLGGMVGGLELGFVLPPAGGDVKWLKENWEEFERRAANGEEEFQEMTREVKERGLLGMNGTTNGVN